MALLSTVHKHIQANRLKDLLATSPLILVYQSLGNTPSATVVNQLKAQLDKELENSGVVPISFKIKNTIVESKKGSAMNRFFQANNLLLGWQVPASSHLDEWHACRHDTLDQIFDTSHQDNQPKLSLPHKTLSAILKLSLSLPSTYPLAVLAGFYQGEQVKISHMNQWSKLDEPSVYSELLAQLEGPAADLCQLDSHIEAMLGALDSAKPDELLGLFDSIADGSCKPAAPDADAASAAAP
eukprot:gene4640-14838_t